MDIGTVAAGFQSARFIGETLKALVGLKIDAESLARVNDAIGKVTDVQSSLFEAQQRLSEQHSQIESLTQQLAVADQWRERAAAYEQVRTPGGAIVMQAKEGLNEYVCPICFERHAVSVLQDRRAMSGVWDCKACSATYLVDGEKPRKPLSFNRQF